MLPEQSRMTARLLISWPAGDNRAHPAQDIALADIVRRAGSIFVLALVLGFVLRKSGSIVAPLLVHAANNFASVVFWG